MMFLHNSRRERLVFVTSMRKKENLLISEYDVIIVDDAYRLNWNIRFLWQSREILAKELINASKFTS